MSGKGSKSKGRKPAHQNTYAFKHNKNSKKTKKILGIPNVAVCDRCREIIEWRKKFRKYKPLKAPKACQKCNNKTVTLNYHIICKKCAENHHLCAKCMKPFDVSLGSKDEESIESQIERLESGKVYGLRERERRTMLRQLYSELEEGDEEDEGGSQGGEDEGEGGGGNEEEEKETGEHDDEGEDEGDDSDGEEGDGSYDEEATSQDQEAESAEGHVSSRLADLKLEENKEAQ